MPENTSWASLSGTKLARARAGTHLVLLRDLVVVRLLDGVGEHRKGLVEQREVGLGVGVVWVLVRMELDGQLLVLLFELRLCGDASEREHVSQMLGVSRMGMHPLAHAGTSQWNDAAAFL